MLKTVCEPENRRLITDIDLHPDADRMLFSMVGEGNRWQVLEARFDGSPPQPLPLIEEACVDNYDACYLPDGTNQSELYGSNSYFPNSFFYARPVPGHPSRGVGVVGGHHGVARAGRLMIIDPDIGRREALRHPDPGPGFTGLRQATIRSSFSW